MARIRSVKPDLPQDRKLAAVPRDARLLFVYGLTIADDEGLFRAEPAHLKTLFPYDDDLTPEALARVSRDLLQARLWRERWTRDGCRVIEIVNWTKHQKIDHKSKSFLAGELAPVEQQPSRDFRETLATQSPESRSPESRSLEKRLLVADAAHSPNGPDPQATFERFWTAYPKRAGSNPKKAARQKWDARVKAGVDADGMIRGAERYAAFCNATSKTNTEYVKQAQSWLSPSFEGWVQPWDAPEEAGSGIGHDDSDFFRAPR
jgi:hypothetical protein